MKRINLFLYTVVAFAFAWSCVACSDEPSQGGEPEPSNSKFGLWVTASESSYILTTDDLMKDTVLSPGENQGIDITGYLPASYYGVYSCCYGGKYYLSNDGTRFSQFEVTEDGRFKETGNLAFGYNFYVGKVLDYASSDSELVFTRTDGQRDAKRNVYRKPIYFLNTKTMTMNKELTAELPYLDYTVYQENGDVDSTTMHVTSLEIRGDKVFMGYDFYNAKWGMVNDSTYIYVCDYPGMTNGKLLKDGRGHTSAHWEITRRAFFDDDKNLYFIIETTADHKKLIRIKNNETQIDPDYLFDLSGLDVEGKSVAELGNGMTYIPPYIMDVRQKKVVADLRVLTGGAEPETYLNYVENGKLYSVFKTKDSRWFVYQYDPVTNNVTKGLEIDGGLSLVYHVNKLK